MAIPPFNTLENSVIDLDDEATQYAAEVRRIVFTFIIIFSRRSIVDHCLGMSCQWSKNVPSSSEPIGIVPTRCIVLDLGSFAE